MNFLNLKISLFIIFIIIIPLIFVNIQDSQLEKNFIFKPGVFITHKTHQFFSHYINTISSTVTLYTYIIQVKKNNQALRKENNQLKIQLMQMREIQIENDRLNALLQFSKQEGFQLLPAKVIAMDPFPNYRLLTIDKGEKDGLKKNMGAIIEEGVIGYVFRVYRDTAQILLLSDRNAVLPATVQRSRVHGLIEGYDEEFLKLKYLRNEDDVQVNDQIVTSGIDSFFPPGLPVGTISQVQKEQYGLSQDVDVRLTAKLSQIEELFIIIKASND
ncbi:MAG: rod shape-determining protein MreC [Bdellovibrionales bacterium]|nr:rod shape-determining protein MreC [Bdellovibrionales bacterium]